MNQSTFTHTLSGVIGIIVGVLLMMGSKCGAGPVPVPSEASVSEAAAADAALEAGPPVTPAAVTAAAACPPGCNPHPCKPGTKITCYGCGFNGGNQQLSGEQVCQRDGLWGACSAGPACSPDIVIVGDAKTTDAAAGPKLEAMAKKKDGGAAPCPGSCTPGASLMCFGCQQGNNQQEEGTRTCLKSGTWGPCSTGPDCQ